MDWSVTEKFQFVVDSSLKSAHRWRRNCTRQSATVLDRPINVYLLATGIQRHARTLLGVSAKRTFSYNLQDRAIKIDGRWVESTVRDI